MLNFDWLSNVPISSARCVFFGLFFLIGVLVWLIPAHYVFVGVERRHWWLDLRWWATGALAILFLTYYLL